MAKRESITLITWLRKETGFVVWQVCPGATYLMLSQFVNKLKEVLNTTGYCSRKKEVLLIVEWKVYSVLRK